MTEIGFLSLSIRGSYRLSGCPYCSTKERKAISRLLRTPEEFLDRRIHVVVTKPYDQASDINQNKYTVSVVFPNRVEGGADIFIQQSSHSLE
jgi:hypothetical protein